MAHGGKRPGAGRKSKADEENARLLAVNAIIATHGSLEEGFSNLLKSQEPGLIKFVFEHAVGKPKEQVEHSGSLIIWPEEATYEADSETN